MTDPTPLDLAHRAMTAAPEETAARLRYFGALSAGELFLLLEREPDDERIEPQVFDIDEGRVVLAFDREDRLTDFTGAPSPYAALPGRTLAALLAGQGLGLCVNLGTEAGELLPADAVDWWAETLATAPEEMDLRPEALSPPGDMPEMLLAALDRCLVAAAGLAQGARLAGIRYGAGEAGHLLAFLDTAPGAEAALARAVADALRFSGLEEGALDIAFFTSGDPMADTLTRVGLQIDLPAPVRETARPVADPDAPPRLR